MKNFRFFAPRLLLCGALVCGSVLAQTAQGQPKTSKVKAANKAMSAPKMRAKNVTPRMVKAIEAQTGKTLSPETKAQLTEALRAREVAIQAANDAYYVQMAQATGLTVEQAKDVDKPARVTRTTEAKVQAKTNMNELTTQDIGEAAPTTPEK